MGTKLGRTIPAPPVRSMVAALDFYRERYIAGTASCRIEVEGVDELYAELRAKEVLHPVSKASVADTDFGTREFSTLDQDGNLIGFFKWVEQ